MSSSTSAEPRHQQRRPLAGPLDVSRGRTGPARRGTGAHGQPWQRVEFPFANHRCPPSPERDVKVISLWYLAGQYGPGSRSAVRRRSLRVGAARSADSEVRALSPELADREPRLSSLKPIRRLATSGRWSEAISALRVRGSSTLAHLDVALVIDVIEVDDGKDARIGAAPFQVGVDVDALEERAERPAWRARASTR